MPLWVRAVSRFGLARCWLAGMVLAIAVFAWAALLGRGDVTAYTVVCVFSGIALGADLTLPGAMLAGVIQRAGHAGRGEGAYFGWWNFATKLNLALAAGLALAGLVPSGAHAVDTAPVSAAWSPNEDDSWLFDVRSGQYRLGDGVLLLPTAPEVLRPYLGGTAVLKP